MNLPVIFMILGICLFHGVTTASEENKTPLTVSLYYESYCPACQDYYQNYVYLAWNFFKGRVLFDLIPYGNAKQWFRNGHWHFFCQHGPKECQANKLHACAVHQACGNTGTSGCAVDKLDPVMGFIHCLISQPDQSKAAQRCAKDAGLDFTGINNCANGAQGDWLLNFYGNRTDEFNIPYTPTAAIDGKQDKDAEQALVETICKLRPKLCRNSQAPVPEVVLV